MRVDDIRRGGLPGAARKPGAAPGFDVLLGAAAPEQAAAAPPAGGESAACATPGAAPASIVAAALNYDRSIQAVAADRQARRHGRAMLRALGALQISMLGGDGAGAGARLATLAADMPAADDPVLRLILREIGVRAAVALARMGANANVSIG